MASGQSLRQRPCAQQWFAPPLGHLACGGPAGQLPAGATAAPATSAYRLQRAAFAAGSVPASPFRCRVLVSVDKDRTAAGCPVNDRDVGTAGLDCTSGLSGDNVGGTALPPESWKYCSAGPPRFGARSKRRRRGLTASGPVSAAPRVLCRRSRSARSQHATAATAFRDAARGQGARAALAMATLEAARTHTYLIWPRVRHVCPWPQSRPALHASGVSCY